MSTYPVNVKANSTAVATAATHTIFAGPARCLGIYMAQPKDLAASTVTIQDASTAVAIFNLPATDDASNKGAITQYVQFPGTGIKCDTSLKVTLDRATPVTVFYG
tara:strand:+ start:768 stop:1082 length:315 start_codon:yes stop_codon:yes gene_type:complete